jgi:septum formation inhibitor-activating ATPase MinD
MNKITKRLKELSNRLDKEAEHFDNLIDILNTDKSKEEIIEEIKRELLLGQLKRNRVVTQEFAILTKGNKILDAEGLRVLSYTESVLKDVSQENSKPVKIC